MIRGAALPDREFYYRQGRDARRMGRDVTDNPHTSLDHASYWWQRGWSDCDTHTWKNRPCQ